MYRFKLSRKNLSEGFDARNRYRLSNTQIQMVKEIGLSPNKFGGLTKAHQELPVVAKIIDNRQGAH